MSRRINGLSLVYGQTDVDATAGIDVSDATIVEFSTAGVPATLTYKDGNTGTYIPRYLGVRVEIHDVDTITYAGIISYS